MLLSVRACPVIAHLSLQAMSSLLTQCAARLKNCRVWLGPAVIAAAAVACYANSLTAPLLFDDRHIQESPLIHTLRPGWRLLENPRAVALYSLALNYALHGEEVAGYHLVNLAIHLAAGWLLLGLVQRTLCSPRLAARCGDAAWPLAMAVALLWTVHPLQTQAVTYIIQRMESLMSLFYLATLYAFVRARSSARPVRWYLVSIACCALGMGTKEVMVTAPLMVLWYDRALAADSWRQLVMRRSWYYLGLAGTWGVLAWPLTHAPRGSLTAGGAVIVPGLSAPRYLASQAG